MNRAASRLRAALTVADPWQWGFLVLAVAALAVYLLAWGLWEVRVGNTLGRSFGIAAAALLAATALYGVRRRAPSMVSRLGLGGARGWLRFHVYGGGLFLLLVLMHTGLRLPSGVLMWWLWVLSLWTAVSGLAGRLLQKSIPRVLAAGLSMEVNYERIPELVEEIRRRAQSLAESCDRSVQELYKRKIAPALAAPERNPVYFLDVTGGARSRLKDLEYLRRLLPAEEKEKLGELERLYHAKLEIDAHYTLQQVLRGWLWLHVPPSLVLLVLVVMHVFTVLYY